MVSEEIKEFVRNNYLRFNDKELAHMIIHMYKYSISGASVKKLRQRMGLAKKRGR